MRRGLRGDDFCTECGDPLRPGEDECCRECQLDVVELEADMAAWDEDQDGYWWDQQLAEDK